jgi:hypothetical protein
VWALTNSWKIDSKHDDAHPRSAGRHLPLHEPGETSHALAKRFGVRKTTIGGTSQ